MTNKLYNGRSRQNSPYMKGVICFGECNDEPFKINGPLDKSLKAIVKKYGIRPEQLYSVSIVAMATVAVGFSAFNAVCITIV